jgi:hypothetical protein
MLLNVYAMHLKKIAGSASTYGDQIGALALCTVAVSVLLFMQCDYANTSPFIRQSVHSRFGQPVMT